MQDAVVYRPKSLWFNEEWVHYVILFYFIKRQPGISKIHIESYAMTLNYKSKSIVHILFLQ